jgi:hypothetical protein
MKKEKQGKSDKKESRTPAVAHNYKDVIELLKSPVGNDITQKIVEALKMDGMEAKVKPVDRGYMILVEEEYSYLENGYDEDKDGLAVHGSVIKISNLRLPWFRDALRKIFGHDSDDALFASILEDDFQHPTWRSDVYFRILPQPIFEEELWRKLMGLRQVIKAGDRYYTEYFRSYFAKVLLEGFSLSNPNYPDLFPKTVKALWSIISEDKDFKEAVSAATVAAKKLIEEAERDPEGLRKTVHEEGRRLWLESQSKE